ncbi:RNA chaperone Hfq [Alteraurantiacibacter buctensis]|uniref:RNA-binding protein Hfq n=1 Tax=Alteraurantiacibacter buctensis TaxID=1503981 RepID=A0A844Z2N2_9SPHN|nr:RNA chaperone Hfq [Alteraurantiacibacter buctensis]MXO72153.1 RNA chaperone Hfq [Alteraurantiacibacter buctensis]
MARATLTPRARPTPPPAPPAPPATAQSSTPGQGAKSGSLQDLFLNYLRKEKISVTMFLVKGVKLQGIVTWFDNFSILLRRDGQSQLVYKHAISTIMPVQQVDVGLFDGHADGGRKQRLLQDVFLSRVREAEVQVTMFLVNGVMLQGRIASFDQFCMLLEREGYVQLAYKHAVSTIQPASHVELSDDYDDEDDGS